MENKETENFTVRLTKEDRNFLNTMARASGVSAGRFITSLIRGKVCQFSNEIAAQVVLCGVARKYGVPDSIAENLKSPTELSGIMEEGRYQKFCDEVLEETKVQCDALEKKFKPAAEDYED